MLQAKKQGLKRLAEIFQKKKEKKVLNFLDKLILTLL